MTTFTKDESGATAIEYGMIIGFMAGLIAISWGSAFEGITDTFNFISTAIAVA